MGQGQNLSCCGCIWSFCCEFHGCSAGYICCSCWMCGNQHLLAERGPECCKCGGCDHGCGSTGFCGGSYYCAPEWMRRYSIREYIGYYRGPLGGDIMVSDLMPPPQQSAQIFIAGGPVAPPPPGYNNKSQNTYYN